MNVIITHVKNPFSFYCVKKDNGREELKLKVDQTQSISTKPDVSIVTHGQYVAVMWENKWVRGVVNLESKFQIWLVDYGCFIRPNDKTVYIDLPPEYKKYPSKVFEASIHGVVPVDKVLNDSCQIVNEVSKSWNKGTVEKILELVANAKQVIFVPIAMMLTGLNDIVIGDLYLDKPNHGMVNIVDELAAWPVFLQRNPELYVKNFTLHYNGFRHHRACPLKPSITDEDLPSMCLITTLEEYNAICDKAPKYTFSNNSSEQGDGSTVVEEISKPQFQLTPEEMEHYSTMSIKIYDREYNALNLLLNKMRDFQKCEEYKKYAKKSVGRATHRTL